jgi:predicted MFS family arabinose efflux permease
MSTPQAPAGSRLGLTAIFGSTFFALVGYFILSPLLLLRLKGAEVSTTLAGLFVATGWLGIFIMTPFASTVAHRMGRRPCMWLASAVLMLCALLFTLTQQLALWFVLNLVSGLAMSLRWVLAEALIAEFCPPQKRGRFVGFFQTLVSATFIIGPALMVWLGPKSSITLWAVNGLNLLGLLWTALIPPAPSAADAGTARVGLRGLWHALVQHPIIMLAGFVGGFFETGVTSILPLYSLALGLSGAAAAVMVSISGLGGEALTIPAGYAADHFADQARGRRTLMVWSASVMLLATLVLPWVAQIPALAWPIVFVWGGAGGVLYSMSMTDIGAREKGITLVNSTAVLVLTYTLGGLVASGVSGALIDWSPTLGFPAVLVLVAATGLVALVRSHRN